METLKADHIMHTEIETGTHLVSASGVTEAFNFQGRGDFDFQSSLPSECFTLKDVEVSHAHHHPDGRACIFIFTSF